MTKQAIFIEGQEPYRPSASPIYTHMGFSVQLEKGYSDREFIVIAPTLCSCNCSRSRQKDARCRMKLLKYRKFHSGILGGQHKGRRKRRPDFTSYAMFRCTMPEQASLISILQNRLRIRRQQAPLYPLQTLKLPTTAISAFRSGPRAFRTFPSAYER